MIDENGKIGGKINLIDLLVVVFILTVILFAVCRSFSFNTDAEEDTEDTVGDPVRIEFTSAEVNDYTVELLETGVPVLNGNTNKDFGVAVDFSIDNATTYFVTDSGRTVFMDIPGAKSVSVTVESTGELDDNGLLIDGFRYGVGYSMVIYVGRCKLWATISGIESA